MKSNNKFKAFLESMSGYDYNLINIKNKIEL